MAMKVNLKLTSVSEVDMLLDGLENLETSSVIKRDLTKRLTYLKAQMQKLDPQVIKDAATKRNVRQRRSI